MRIELLDHGYIELIESWGSDERVIEAARMSTSKGFLGWEPAHSANCEAHKDDHIGCLKDPECHQGDKKLLRYLWLHKHYTPFEMAGAVVEVQAPIFVFREWHRHRTQSYNEMSARYMPLPDVNYIPTAERLFMGGGHLTKQAGTIKEAEALSKEAASDFLIELNIFYNALEAFYQESLKRGISKELARIILPVGRYSRMRASANLRNWLAFLSLRMAHDAQYEIRVYADAMHEILSKLYPRTMALFDAKV
jgi:thymidylate synthase (FAD)